MADLTTKYLGLTLKNPIIIGSSGLTNSVENIVELEKAGAGAVVLKSLFEEQIILETEADLRKAYKDDHIYTAKSEALDYLDIKIRKDTLDEYIGMLKAIKAATTIPVIASVNCVSATEWTFFAKRIEEAGADALELNIAVLPSDPGLEASDIEKIYFDIISKVKGSISIPLAVKFSPYFTNLASIITRLSETGIKGMVMFNRFYTPDFDISNFSEKSSNTFSTPAETANVLRWIAIMSGRVKVDIAASTGVHDGNTLIKQLLAGAKTVQLVSAIYNNGVGHLQNLLFELENWMDKKEYKTIDDFRGKLAQGSSNNPAAYERIQFMKYFSEIV